MSSKDSRSNAQDERAVRQNPAAEVRGTMPAATGENDRHEDGLAFTLEERLAMLRNETSETALPNPPAIPGWHFCWLSTTNQYDTISRRVRMGYVPVKSEELKGFDRLSVRGGEYEGCVSVNEMVLFKIEEELWQAYMTESHHTAPNAEQSRLAESVKSSVPGDARDLVREVQGFDERLVSRRPTFSN
jgi:hypothetical protein